MALGVFGVWFLAYDLWFTGRTNAECVSQVITIGGDGSTGRACASITKVEDRHISKPACSVRSPRD